VTDAVYNIIQFGRQASFGTPVSATTLFPADAGFTGFELDRASESPDEDFGDESREQPGRESTGVRLATAQLPFVARFQDLMHAWEMHAHATSGTPSGTAAPYSYSWTLGAASHAVAGTPPIQKLYTVEYGVKSSTQDEWEARDVIATGLELGFDALSAPGNSMWRGTLDLVASDRVPATLTASQSAPAALETIEGHLTRLYQGDAGTAFASLPELTSLKQFSFNSGRNNQGRAYGGTADKISAWGQSAKGETSFDAMIGITSTSKSGILDIYETAGSQVVERRWRVKAIGSGDNALTLDFRCRFRAVQVGDHEGERLYAVSGVMVRDTTVGGRLSIGLTNAVSVVP
jgi:hypothetical protein